jgi:hypothetical protein
MKKGVRTGPGSISQRYGSGDPDPHQNVTDPQHWKKVKKCIVLKFWIFSLEDWRLLLYLGNPSLRPRDTYIAIFDNRI